MLILIAGWLLVGSVVGDVLCFDLADREALFRWQVAGEGQAVSVPGGVLVRPQPAAMLLSPQLDGERESTWSQRPYVVIRVKSEAHDRAGDLVWNPQDRVSQSPRIPFRIPAGAHTVVLNTQSEEYWNLRSPWRGPIRRFGLLLRDAAEVQGVSLRGGLSLGA